jgi:sortase A
MRGAVLLSNFKRMYMIRKYLPRILIFLGIVIMGTAVYLEISTEYYQKKLVEEYDRYVSEIAMQEGENEEPSQPAAETPPEINSEEEKPQEAAEVNPVDKYLEGKELSGIIEIPKLGVKAAILEGTDDRALKYTVGHYPGTANPGEKGNCVLLGHRNYVYGHYFRKLNELEAGDRVIIRRGTDTFTYTVTESFVVEPEEVWVLDPAEDAVLTMITCTPVPTYTHRLIVRGVISE